jgi:hypothetical protein
MVTKNKSEKEAKNGRVVKIDNMKLNKETVRDLTPGEEKSVRGGAAPRENLTGKTCTSCRC